MARLTIYHGRISVDDPALPGQEEMFEREPIRDAVISAKSVKRYNHEWILGNLDVDEGQGLVTGRLGYPQTEHRTQQDFDPQSVSFVELEYDLPDAVSGAFALDYRSGDIAFEGDDIGPNGFINHFVALLSTTGAVFRGELARYAETYREFIEGVDKVTRVWFEVRPTNPRDRPIFRPLDVGMKASNATRQRVVIENVEEGLLLHPPDSPDEETANPAVMGIEMNEDGYGEGYRIDGEKEGRPLRFDSKAGGSLIREVLEDVSDDPDERARIVAELFRQRSGDQIEESPAKPLEPSVEQEGASLSETMRSALLEELDVPKKPLGELNPPTDEGNGNSDQ